MHWLKKATLFILSTLFIFSCEQSQESLKSKSFNLVQNIDSVFVLAHEWSEEKPPIPDELMDILDKQLDSIKIHGFNSSQGRNAIIFSAENKSQFEIFEKTPTLKELNKVSYESYTVWRSNIDNKEILEFSLQPHPTMFWTFTIRKRGQE